MQSILQSKYYDIGTYLVETRSQGKLSGIGLPQVHGLGKGLDPNILQEKQVIKPILTSEVKAIS